MYTEKQHHLPAGLRGLRALTLGLTVVQAGAFVAAETGLPTLPFGPGLHLGLLLLSGLLTALLWQSGLVLRVDTDGLALRFLPWQWRFLYIRWPEIRRLRLLPANERLPGARFGLPSRDFTQAYWLSSPELRILSIELVNNTRLYVTTENPAELLDFLQHGLLTTPNSMVKFG